MPDSVTERLQPDPANVSPEVVEIITKELVEFAPKKSLQQEIVTAFGPTVAVLNDWKQKVEALNKDTMNPEDWAMARNTRLSLVKVRTGSEKLTKELKAESLKRSNSIQAIFNFIKKVLEPLEDKLAYIEETGKRIEEEKLDQLEQKRKDELTPFDVDVSFYDLRTMDPDRYTALYEQLKSNFEAQEKQKAQEQELFAARESLGQARYKELLEIDPSEEEGRLKEFDYLLLGSMEVRQYELLKDDWCKALEKKELQKQLDAAEEAKNKLSAARANQLTAMKINPDLYDLKNMSEDAFKTLKENLAIEQANKATQELRASRMAVLGKFEAIVPASVDVGTMSEEEYNKFLCTAEADYNLKQANILEEKRRQEAPEIEKMKHLIDNITVTEVTFTNPKLIELQSVIVGEITGLKNRAHLQLNKIKS